MNNPPAPSEAQLCPLTKSWSRSLVRSEMYLFIFSISPRAEPHPVDVHVILAGAGYYQWVSEGGEFLVEPSHCQPVPAVEVANLQQHQHCYFQLSGLNWIIGQFVSPWTGRKQHDTSSRQSRSWWSSACNLLGWSDCGSCQGQASSLLKGF